MPVVKVDLNEKFGDLYRWWLWYNVCWYWKNDFWLKNKMGPITIFDNLKEEFENKKIESSDFFELLELLDSRDDFSYK